uniref:Pentatricopeptide repeat-containing protein At4g30700 n=1 Tax=Anthurium amnicola TaxID=1678845 RepID=A0A1D1XWU5_9ARAE
MLCRSLSHLSAASGGGALRPLYLDLISRSTTLHHLHQIHAHTILTGHHAADIATVTKLVQKLSDLGAIDHARHLFDEFPSPDLFLFNVLIRSFSLNGAPVSAISFYSLLRRDARHLPDDFTYAFAANAAASFDSPRMGRMLHAHSIVDGYTGDPFVGSAFASLYFHFGQVPAAEKVFDGIASPDTVSCNTLISGLAHNGCFLNSMKAFAKLLPAGLEFDSTTLAAVLPAVAELQDLIFGMVVHCLGMKVGLSSHAFVVTGLISMYSKCGNVAAARLLFVEIGRLDLIAWNAMISGYSYNGDVESSVGLFRKLLLSGAKVNSSTVVGLIPVFCPFGHANLSECIHGYTVKCGLDSNSLVSTALTTVYCRVNDIESARKLFEGIPEKGLASWNAMISGYAQSGLTEMAISLFKLMQTVDIRPNPVTVTSILSACAQLGALTLGKWVHQIINEQHLEPNVFVFTAMIDMYAKCGSIKEARCIFDSMVEKNVVSWNAMIAGYGLHGLGCEALDLFSEMLNAFIAPTGVTFLSVLYACSHAGLVEQGRKVFLLMESDYGIKPGPEHFACMVDLLGRAGQLQEAFAFIKAIPTDPGPGVWGALLGACMIHKDTNLARVASDRLFMLEPDSTGYYVLLSNVHSAGQNYREAALVRQVVKNKKLMKTPGCTIIEVGNMVHVFTSGDRSHEQTTAIYQELERLTGKMVEAGYSAVTDMAMYDVEEEEKLHMLKVHSEKLAICFGLISTEPGIEIRIIKNLRVCLDCHNATKFISKITNRVIVVRDANRFHHFRDGICSCGDYW